VPELDFALISDYVRAEGGIAHIAGARQLRATQETRLGSGFPSY
jgi:hypothetical protein